MYQFLIVTMVIFILALVGYFLFFANRFYLKVVPKGESEITIAYGESYTDSGAEARIAGTLFFREGFAVDGKINANGNVDMYTPGTYTVDYEANYLFLTGRGSRTVTVVDTVPPEIILNYISGHYTASGERYQEEGFRATDNCDGDITANVTVEEVNGYVIYTVIDSSGNLTRAEREILYRDVMPPVITLNGGDTCHIHVAEEFLDPGFTATDNVDGDVSHLVTVEGAVNPYAAGSYTLTYTVADAEGNVTVVQRTVFVDQAERAETVTPKGKTIYLTFDDGPCAYTKELLRVLRRYGVKATFFVVDTGSTDLIREIAEEGHAIGIHSVSHDYKEIYSSEEAFFADLLGMQQIIYEHSGVMTYLMRFPGGSSNTISNFNEGIMTRLTKAVEDAGFYYFDWNVDSNDAGGAKTAKKVFENVKKGVQKHKVSIVLQHDIKDFSVDAVEKIISWGLENGYSFRALDETSPGAHHDINN